MSMGLVMVGCDALGGEPTPVPTITPTPLTDIRFAATAVPAGLPGNPLQMVMQPVSPDLYIEPEVTEEPGVGEVTLPVSSTQTELDLEEAILNYSSVTVDIVPVERPADALRALCESSENVSAVWVEGVAFSAALAQNCGEPIYVVRKRINGELEIGEPGLIIMNRQFGGGVLSGLNTRTFCRLAVDDFYSWLLPLMIFRANNVDPSRFEAVVDYDDAEALVEAVSAGECAGAGLSGLVYDDIIEDDETLADTISVAYGTPPIPYAVLMYPVEMQLGIRVSLTEGLEQLSDDDDDSELLNAFLGQDGLLTVDAADFTEYQAFLDEVDLDFSILGD